MATRARKTWAEKLNDKKDLPRIERIPHRMRKRFGSGSMTIPAPREVDAIMKRVLPGKIITINRIREKIARKHRTDIACPITTGIFSWIAAHAADEQRQQGEQHITPYWRTLKEGGVINEKYPGGIRRQARLLRKEGHQIITKGTKQVVANWQKNLLR